MTKELFFFVALQTCHRNLFIIIKVNETTKHTKSLWLIRLTSLLYNVVFASQRIAMAFCSNMFACVKNAVLNVDVGT